MGNVQDIDTQIRERIMSALKEDTRTAEASVEVVNQQGVVTLKGTVETEKTRQAAVEIASEPSEVFTVIDELAVAGGQEDGEWLEAPEAAVFDSRAPYIPDLNKEKEG